MRLELTGFFNVSEGGGALEDVGIKEQVGWLLIDEQDGVTRALVTSDQRFTRDGAYPEAAGKTIAEVFYPVYYRITIVRWNGTWQPKEPRNFLWMTMPELWSAAQRGEVSFHLYTALGVLLLSRSAVADPRASSS